MIECVAKHLQAAEGKEGAEFAFALIQAGGGPTVAEMRDMYISETAGYREEVENAFDRYGDITPDGDYGWTVELAVPVGEITSLKLREPKGKDLKTTGKSGYQKARNLLLSVATTGEGERLSVEEIGNLGIGDFSNIVNHLVRVGGGTYQGF